MELTRQEKIVLFFLVGAVFASLIFFLSRVFVYRIPGSSPTPNTEIVVQIEGEVRKPGVFRVPGGMRVYELIEMAGGSQPGADLSGLNLAAPLQDGQRLVVSTSPPEKGTFTSNFSTLASALPPSGKKNDLPANPSSVNVNTASLEELKTLSGIGDVIAQRIITYREENGLFKNGEDFLKVNGIGPKKLEKIRDHITF